MSIRFCFIIIFLFKSLLGFSEWTPWVAIYNKEGIKVELQFKLSTNSCEQGGITNKFRYQITGKLKSYDYFINWKMDYYECNGNLYYQQNSINIGRNGSLGIIEAMDYMFTSRKLENPFYEVIGTSNSNQAKGIKINPVSKTPDAIEGTPYAVYGNATELSVKGGSLGSGANWVWYSGSCGSNPIGKGNIIYVSPTAKTTYFVRAEGPTNKTICIEKTIQIVSKSPDVILGKTDVYAGEEVELTLSGGFLMSDATWVWYENYNKIGTGKSIKVKPTKNTEYSVRAESPQNMSNKVAILIKLKSNDPTLITGDDTVFFGDSTVLTVEGGFLLPNQKYVWYEEKVGGDILGKAKSIYVSPLETSTFYVRAEGGIPSAAIYKIINVQEVKVPIGRKFNPEIANIDFSNNNGKVEIKYDIINSVKSDRFIVHIDAYNKKSIPLLINSLAGDTINVKGGTSKKIIWDSKKDGYEFDEKIYFNICATSQVNIPFGAHLIKSMIFPGWGDLKFKTERKYPLLYGIAGFAFGTGAIVLNQQAMQSYKSYENSFETVQSNKYYNDAVAKRNQSRILAISACLVWTVDLTGLYYKYNKIKNNLTYANCPYYYSRSHILFNSNSQLQLINTKGQ